MIEISHIHNKAFIWNANDVSTLRENHRIVGCLTGCLPRCPQQNSQLGLPLQLLPEEVTLLLEKGLAKVIDHQSLKEPPSDEQVKVFTELRQKNYEQQNVFCQVVREDYIKNHADVIIEGKRAKRKKIVEQQQSSEQITDLSESNVLPSDEELIQEELNRIKNFKLPETVSVVQLFSESPWLDLRNCPEINWTYPSSEKEKIRYFVFRELWNKGYFLTPGGKFGGDFLAYPGDPLVYHSFFIVVCLSEDQKLNLKDLILQGRLGANVKKTVLLATVNNENEVMFLSLQWSGM